MIILRKNIGETPLQCVQRTLDTERNIHTYAGRLDPMAEGLLLVLENEECGNAKHYHGLHKTYDYTFIVGIATDTYDTLGHITDIRIPDKSVREKVSESISALRGTITLPYPPYSSKTVNGIPLFTHAKQRTLNTITVPEKTITITNHTLIGTKTISLKNLKRTIMSNLKKAPDGFRREDIRGGWSAIEHSHRIPSDTQLQHFSATVSGSGGMYVRAIVHEIGRRIGCPAVTTAINRTKIGQWTQPGRYPLPPKNEVHTR